MARAALVLSLLLTLTGTARAEFQDLLTAARTGDTAVILELLATGEAANPPSYHHGYSPLQFAAERSDVDAVRALLAAGADTEYRDHNGDRALLWAAKRGQSESVRLLLDAGSPPDSADDPYGRTPLMEAASVSSGECVALLLSAGADPHRFDQTATTALHHAVGSPTATRMLLAAGANPNVVTEYIFWTPLHYAAAYGDPDVIRMLLAADAAREVRTGNGETPLMLATRAQEPERVAALLEAGADVEVADDYGLTPLLVATRDGFVDTARLLLAAGARTDIVDHSGQGVDHYLDWHPAPRYVPEGSRMSSIGTEPDPDELARLDAAHAAIRALIAAP